MRNTFIKILEQRTKENSNIMLLTGDLGFTVFENYATNFPHNFFNMGVAEANMMGVASGLSLTGKIPFVYSIAPFITLRPIEQIRNDVCLHNANVKIVGVGAGLSYSHAGPTHHINEDIGMLKTIPNITIICPSDPVEVELAVNFAIKHEGPIYIRLGKKGEPVLHKNKNGLDVKKAIEIRKGTDILLLSHGSIINNTLKTADILKKQGFSSSVVSIPTIKPIDLDFINRSLSRFKYIFTIEEHNIIGGLGSSVGEVIAESKKSPVFKRIGINDQFCEIIGDHDYMRDYYGLSPSKISQTIVHTIKKNNE